MSIVWGMCSSQTYVQHRWRVRRGWVVPCIKLDKTLVSYYAVFKVV